VNVIVTPLCVPGVGIEPPYFILSYFNQFFNLVRFFAFNGPE